MKNVDALIADLYDTALTGAQWQTVLTRAAEAFDSSHSLIYTPHASPQQGGFFFSHNVAPEAIAAHESHYRPLDLWTRGHGTRKGGCEGGFIGEMFVPFDELTRSEFYADFLRPQGLHHLVTSVVHERPRAGQLVSFAMFRGPRQPAFEESHRLLSERLGPHIQRALLVRERLRCLEQDRRIDTAMLDRAPVALFLVDRAGKVRRMTETAETLVARANHLHMRHGFLQAVESTGSLAKAIREVAAGGGEPFSRLLSVVDKTGEDRIHVLVARADTSLPGHAYVLVGPVASTGAASLAGHLQPQYGLTPAEVRLCELLQDGRSTNDIADLHAVKRSTVVSQLKSVFLKTGTSRQSHLMKLLLDLASLR